TPERRTGVPGVTPGASAKVTVYSWYCLKKEGRLPNSVTSVASSTSVSSTNSPIRKRIPCSVMGPSSLKSSRPQAAFRSRPGAGQLVEALAGLALDELAHARVGAALQLGRGAVEDHLRLARPQAGQRVEHHNAVGHLGHRLHVVGDDEAGDRVPPPRLQDQLVDHVRHDRIEAGG